MDIFNFDQEGYFLNEGKARRDPMEKEERYLLPAMATFTAPPKPTAGKWPRWNGSAWSLEKHPDVVQQERLKKKQDDDKAAMEAEVQAAFKALTPQQKRFTKYPDPRRVLEAIVLKDKAKMAAIEAEYAAVYEQHPD